jgi:hypothetical protein
VRFVVKSSVAMSEGITVKGTPYTALTLKPLRLCAFAVRSLY